MTNYTQAELIAAIRCCVQMGLHPAFASAASYWRKRLTQLQNELLLKHSAPRACWMISRDSAYNVQDIFEQCYKGKQ